RHVMPRVVDRLASAVAAAMFCDDAPILADDDPISVGVDLDRSTDRTGVHRVFVVVEADQAGLRYRGRQCVEAIEATAIRDELWPLLLERLPHRPIWTLRMGMRLRVGDTLVHQPGVQFVVALHPQPGGEE